MPNLTQILAQIEGGDEHAAEDLLPLLYNELRRLAAQRMSGEKTGHSLQATALVHEAYLRLVDNGRAQHFNGRNHFLAAAAEAMRRILVENARRKASLKRGGDHRRVNLDESAVYAEAPADNILAVSEALDKLAQEDPKKAELVKLRFFAGLSVQEAADVLGVSRATADRYWAYAKVWLYCEISGEGKKPSQG